MFWISLLWLVRMWFAAGFCSSLGLADHGEWRQAGALAFSLLLVCFCLHVNLLRCFMALAAKAKSLEL